MRDRRLLTIDIETVTAQAQAMARQIDAFLLAREGNLLDKLIAIGGIAQEESNILPLTFALHSPIPNPSASGAMVRYDLPRPALVELRIYDVTGVLVRRLVEGAQPAGYQRAYWNGRDERGRTVAPGVYYCRFKADDFLATHKMVVRR